MKVVIDTNVVVSAALKDRDPEAVILFVAGRPEFEWVVSADILEEYRGVLGRGRFGLSEELLQKWDEIFGALTATIEVDVEIDFPRDRKDAKFLACALVADAEYLITGDKDFTEAQKLVNTTILSVSMFRHIVMEAWG